MSVVVYDGKLIACDLMRNDGVSGWPVEKMEVFGTQVIVAIGYASSCRTVIEWYKDPKRARFPTNVEHGTRLILASKEQGLISYDHMGSMSKHGFNKCAFGSGADFAYGALAHGANAIEAVEAANKYSVTCGLGVMAYEVDGLKRTR